MSDRAEFPRITIPPGMRVHWFNDVGNRVELALAAGWIPLRDEEGVPIVINSGHPLEGPVLCHALMKPISTLVGGNLDPFQ